MQFPGCSRSQKIWTGWPLHKTFFGLWIGWGSPWPFIYNLFLWSVFLNTDPTTFFGLKVSQVGGSPDPSLQHFLTMNRLGKPLTLSYNIFWTDRQSGWGSAWPFPTTFFWLWTGLGSPWPFPTTFFLWIVWTGLGKLLTLPYNIFFIMNRLGKLLTLPYNIFFYY